MNIKLIKKITQKKISQWPPPGHFYSPIPSIDEIKSKEKAIFTISSKKIPAINLNGISQLKLLKKLKKFYKNLPFEANKKDNLRYFFNNPCFSYGDAIIYYCMIRKLKPKRIIEIGTGYSSCVALDTNELFFDNSISCTFIDPYPKLFLSLIKKSDKNRIKVINKNLQEIDLKIFSGLSCRDILFIDSTHVSKINSDVNYIFFQILPCLKAGVFIHFHDIFFPFEYPKEWVYQGLAWNEAYLLRVFLQYNKIFKIQFFNSFMAYWHRKEVAKDIPLFLKNTGGSIWINKCH